MSLHPITYLLFIALGVKQPKPKHHSKSLHHLKKPKSGHHQLPEQKSSIRDPGMAFEETSTESIKSRLDKSLGVLGPWKQNAGDLYLGNMGLDGQERLLNQPTHPVMRINGYPINPKGSMSLTQMIDGTLDNDLDLQMIGGQMKFPSRPLRGQMFRGMAPQAMGMGSSRGMPQRMMGRMMFGNMIGGHKRETMHRNRKLGNKPPNRQLVSLPSRAATLSILGRMMLHRTTALHNQNRGKKKHDIFMKKRNKKQGS